MREIICIVNDITAKHVHIGSHTVSIKMMPPDCAVIDNVTKQFTNSAYELFDVYGQPIDRIDGKFVIKWASPYVLLFNGLILMQFMGQKN
jgi:hypothetical protein